MKHIIRNSKAVTAVMGVIILILIIGLGVVIAAFSLGGSQPSTANNAVTVFIDGVEQKVNITEAQLLDWGAVTAGNTYTKNFTVANYASQPYTMLLLTAEPAGTAQTWAYNNTVLNAQNYAQGSLTLTLSTSPLAGSYTWRLIASNNSAVTPTPSPDPEATPTPNSLNYKLSASSGIVSVNVTYNGQTPFTKLASDLPVNYTMTAGDTFIFRAVLQQGYAFNGWDFQDGTQPYMQNPIVVNDAQGNFTIKATAILVTP